MSSLPRWCLALVTALVLAACSGGDYQDVLRTLLEKQHLVEQLRSDVLLAGEAGKNAVLATDETEAGQFASQARQAMSRAKEDLARLDTLVAKAREAKQADALARVADDVGQLEAVGNAILGMAGRNTNLRASLLSHTQATQAAGRLGQALAPISDGPDCPAGREALRAVNAALTILSLQDRHIDEPGDADMDRLEAAMAAQNSLCLAALDRLAALAPADAAAVAAARTAQADLWRVTGTIIQLSRENSNINALALVMGRARQILAKTLDDQASLAQCIEAVDFKATR